MPRDKTSWNADDLVRRVCRALSIAEQSISRLLPAGYTDAADPALNVRPEKIVAETAFLLVAASCAADHAELRQRIDRVAALLAPHARSEKMFAAACVEPALFLDYAQAHVCLTRVGHGDPHFDALLRRALQHAHHARRERAPHRALEQRWIAESWRNCAGGALPRAPLAPAQSALDWSVDLVSASREDIYAFTHALMYLADFSLQPRWRRRERTRITADAETALARCLDEEDYDLAGEVLLAWPLTGCRWSPQATFGFGVLARVEDQAGFLPNASTRVERLGALQGSARTAYALATAYHTAYVMGLLCAAALRPGRAPPVQIAASASRRGAARALLERLAADHCQAHWLPELERLDAAQIESLAPLLLAVALRRRGRERAYDAIRDLLSLASTHRLHDLPCAQQAARMLERLSCFAQLGAPREARTGGLRHALAEGF